MRKEPASMNSFLYKARELHFWLWKFKALLFAWYVLGQKILKGNH